MQTIAELISSIPTALPFVADLLLRLTVLLVIVQLVSIALRRTSASTRHLVITMGFVAAIALPAVMLLVPDARLEVLPAETASVTEGLEAPTDALTQFKTGAELEPGKSSTLNTTTAIANVTGIEQEKAIGAARTALWFSTNWQNLFLFALALVPLALLGRIAMGMVAVYSIARTAHPVTDATWLRDLDRAHKMLGLSLDTKMLVSSRINVPLVWGFMKPVLILPESSLEWTRERFRVVVLHELAHVRRYDVVSLFVGRLSTALYWFHPMSWKLEREGRRECERACDDLVLENGAKASDYADHLLGIAAGEDLAESYAEVTLAMARPSELEGRLVAILSAEGSRRAVPRKVALIAALATAVMLLPLGAVQLTAKSVDLTPDTMASDLVPVIEVDFSDNEFPAEVVSITTDEEIVVDGTVDIELDEDDVVVVTGDVHYATDYSVTRSMNSDVVLVHDGPEAHTEEYKIGAQWFKKAGKYLSNDQYDKAIDAYQKAIEGGYKPGTSMYNTACAYSLKGDVQNAVRYLDDAVKNGFTNIRHMEKDSDLDPIRSDARFRGFLRDAQNQFGVTPGRDRFEQAREYYEQLRATGSDDADQWHGAGLKLLQLRQLDRAIDALETAVRLEPEAGTAHYNLSCAYAIKGDSQNALNALEKSILNGFDSPDKLQNDPDLDSIRGNSRFADIQKIEEDLALWPRGNHEHRKWNEKALFRDSMPRYEEATRRYPDAGRAWFNLGYASLELGDTARSRDSFQRALDLGYRTATSMYNLACVESVAGNREGAFQWLTRAEKTGATLGNLEDDDDLDKIRDDPRFDEFLERSWKRHDEMKHEKMRQKREQKEQERKERERTESYL